MATANKPLGNRQLLFGLFVAAVALLLVVGTILVFDVVQPSIELRRINERALKQVRCSQTECNTSDLDNDWEHTTADYLIMKATRFFLLGSPHYPNYWLNVSDPAFVTALRVPSTRRAPNGEVWRLYSQQVQIGGARAELLVGYREDASWALAPCPATPVIDARLRKEAKNIQLRLTEKSDKARSTLITTNADGYDVIDSTTTRIIRGNGELPAYLPRQISLPSPGLSFYKDGSDLLLIKTDENDSLVATSLAVVGNIWWLAAALILVPGAGFTGGFVAGKTTLKRYLTFYRRTPISVSEALKAGEDQQIEFKRGLVEEDLLKSITAFANTDGGTIFLGIDDHGKIQGLEIDAPKAKDLMKHRLYTAIRNRIKPLLLTNIDLECSPKFCSPRGA